MFPGRIILLLALALPACGGSASEDEALPPAASPTPSAAMPSPAPSDAAAVPIEDERYPSAFSGDDDQYLRRVRLYLEQRKVKTDLSRGDLGRFGREFCFVLSGGGRVADKVDYWAGLNQLGNGPDVPIFLSAWEVYCPEYADGYVSARRDAKTRDATDAERADLVRFVSTTSLLRLDPRFNAMPDDDLHKAGKKFCNLPFRTGWLTSEPVVELTNSIPDAARFPYLMGLGLAYCPDQTEKVMRDLRDRITRDA